MINIILGIVVTVVLLLVTYILLKRRQGERPDLEDYETLTMDKLLRIVKNEMAEATREDDVRIINDVNYEAVVRNRHRLNTFLRDSTYGIPDACDVIIGVIKDIVQRELPTKESVYKLIPFDDVKSLDPQTQWELLCVKLRPICGLNVIKYINQRHHISELRVVDPDICPRKTREFDHKMLNAILQTELYAVQEQMKTEELISYDEMTEVIAIELFSQYHGAGAVETLMRLTIDGINLGTSGSIRYAIDGNWDAKYRKTNATWVMVGQDWTQFSFLDFVTEGEMKRVINQLVSWGSAAPMSEARPYKVVDGYDGSRRVAIRPGAGECWACFIRKFTLSIHTVEWLLNKPRIKNWELPAQLLYFLMKAEQTVACTGQQGTGKTTMMAAIMEFIENMNIRCLEMSFELALREVYPEKNIMTVKPTDFVSAAMLQDLLKKTDGWVSCTGEVAEDIVAARMIQFCLIGSAFTLFSHHGKDDEGLIDGLTNSLVACGEYKDHKTASATVLDAIRHNVHMTKYNGERPIEYISQIVKENTVQAYPEMDQLLADASKHLKNGDSDQLAKALVAMTMLMREFYTRTTDRVKFTSRYIIKFNKETMTYEAGDWYTKEMADEIMSKLPPADKKAFALFALKNWGNKVGKVGSSNG